MSPAELVQAYEDKQVRPLINLALPQHLVPEINWERDKCTNTNYNLDINDILNKTHKQDYIQERRRVEAVKKKIESIQDDVKTNFNLENIEDSDAY